MKIGDLVKYSEEAAKNRIAAVYYDSEYGIAEVKEELVVVS